MAIPWSWVVVTIGMVWLLVGLWEGVSDEMGEVTNGKVLAFGGVEVQLPISGPVGADI